jgi:carbon starvation protein
MNVGLLMLASVGVLLVGYLVYGRLIARVFGIEPERRTPAIERNDGVDYVPTHPVVLFGHHFASIAAAGPIVGPTLALMFGFVPAWAWILVGVVLIGAVHDFAALFVSIREGGRSVAEVARTTLGTAGFVLYAAFAILLCILVSAAFLDLTAKSLTALYPVTALGLPASQGVLATAVIGGVEKAKLGGIASTSVVVITLGAPLLGWALYKRGLNPWFASGLALAACIASVALGFAAPLTIAPKVWMIVILVYTLVAGFLPVWLVLQPRDFVNVQLLYIGLFVLVATVIGCGLFGVQLDVPSTNVAAAEEMPALGAMWPFLFVTIACGSVSGAHGLICGGTTCKQIASEKHARAVGYGGMLLEGLLAVCVILVLSAGLGFEAYREIVWTPGGAGAPVAFAVAVGRGMWKAVGSPEAYREIIAYGAVFGIILLEGFLVTTIDTVVRLSRYLLEELVRLAIPHWNVERARARVLLTIAVIVPTALLAFSNGYQTVWPLFGSANQLLASLTLTAVSLWLWRKGRAFWFTAVPAVFMMVTTIGALATSLSRFAAAAVVKLELVATAAALLTLAAGVVIVTLREVFVARHARSAQA